MLQSCSDSVIPSSWESPPIPSHHHCRPRLQCSDWVFLPLLQISVAVPLLALDFRPLANFLKFAGDFIQLHLVSEICVVLTKTRRAGAETAVIENTVVYYTFN
ncbi:hypothetical protein BT96DRAFT_351397 [Gymnopus androsaceus JB14]|uniref:Uncharacterized protein n=1 Tax=Gymnopus androsaceus JB14 TaxID=1447944 RepID=A0A6A4GWZ8_9AGAR|nr:hypothetical protein BT96DRAFT_351397 [Gymnopus androsaceus JB14]